MLKIDIDADTNTKRYMTFPLYAENKVYFFLSGRKRATNVIIKWYIRTMT
jgi:hypothetical protein